VRIFFRPRGAGTNEVSLIVPTSYTELMYYLYILQSEKDNNFYTGTTGNLERRIKEHQAGKNISTSYRRPLRLIYYEAYVLKEDAEAREKYLKTSMGRRVIRKQISHYLEREGKIRI